MTILPSKACNEEINVSLEELKEYMREYKVSQTDLANKTGVPIVTINRWLKGHCVPTENLLKLIRLTR